MRDTIDAPLTMEELRERLDVSSKSVVHHHVLQLEKRGYLKRNPNNPKDYTILTDPERPVVYVNMYGLAQCGAEGFFLNDSPIDRVPIASKLVRFPAQDAFIVEAKGDSMTPRIHEGDLIIARRQNSADMGDIVVCVNDGVTIVKKYEPLDSETIILESINSNHPKLKASPDFRIVGVLKSILSFE